MTPLSPFRGHLGRLISGTLGAQLLAVATYPIITRLFAPDSFGIYAIFLSIVSFTSLLAAFGAEAHIVRAVRDNDAWDIFRLSCFHGVIVAAVSVLAAAAYWIGFSPQYSRAIVPLIGAGTAIGSFANTGVYLGIRAGRSRAVSASRIAAVGVAAALQLGLGLLGLVDAAWLILAHVIAQGAVLGVLWPSILHYRRLAVSGSSLAATARRHYGTLLLVGPGNLLANAALQLPAVIVGATAGANAAGQFGLMMRSVGLPMSVLGTAAGQAALIDSSAMLREGSDPRESARVAHRRMLRFLLPVALAVAGVLALWAPSLFRMVFGPEWRDAGVFSRLMAPAIAMQLVTSPSSQLVIVARDERYWLLWNVARTALMLGSLLTAGLLLGTAQAIAAFSGVQVVLYAILQTRMLRYRSRAGCD